MKVFGETIFKTEIRKRFVSINGIEIQAEFFEGEEIEFSLKNSSSVSKYVEDLEIGELIPSKKMFMNNFQSWGPCTFVKPEEVFTFIQKMDFNAFMMSVVPWELKKGVVSDYFIATGKEFAGFLSSKVAHPYFLWENGIIKMKIYVGKALKPKEELKLDPLWVTNYDSLEKILRVYAQKVASLNEPKIGKPIFGWSSWYDYYLDISQKAFIDEMEKSKDLNLKYKLFQLDDGYESDIGDWLNTNDKFPDGLEFLAKKAKENGMMAGIWTAPFSVSESSKLFKAHSDWLVKSEGDEPIVAYENWNKKIYALDTTHPAALKWLGDLFFNLKKMGFDFFKIDFLFAGIIPGKRYLDVTPVEAYRMGMETIRKVVGGSYILGCGAPLLPSIGYVDSMRIGADTSSYWDGKDFGQPSAKYSIRNALTRNFMNDVWWTNDPDCVMARSKGTELEENERMVNVYVPALLNGHFIESDKISLLTQEDVCFLKSALNFRGGSSSVKFVDPEKYVIVSRKTINGDVISFVNLSDSRWNVRIDDFSNLLDKKEDEFFVFYPTVEETERSKWQEVEPHSILIVLHRGKRKITREDEKKKDGRDFHYYRDDEI